MSPGRSGAKSLVIRSVSELFGEGLSRDLGGGGGSLRVFVGPDIPRSFERGVVSSGYWGETVSPDFEGQSLLWSLRGLPGILAVQDLPRSLRRFSQTFVGERSPWVIASQDSGVRGVPGYWGLGVLLESAGGGVSPPPQVPFTWGRQMCSHFECWVPVGACQLVYGEEICPPCYPKKSQDGSEDAFFNSDKRRRGWSFHFFHIGLNTAFVSCILRVCIIFLSFLC